jgi:spore coat polysaccharide biosynthesis protein SpsF
MINATIEVRMTSSRLPGKPLMLAGGITMLEILIRRLSQSRFIEKIIVATTTNKQDNPIIEFCIANNLPYYRGSEHNVLERVYAAAKQFHTDTLVQITGDCPLIDYRMVDDLIEIFNNNYPTSRVVSNTGPEISMPWGFDIQVYKADELKKVLDNSPSEEDKEHVSQRFYSAEFNGIYNLLHIKYGPPLNRPELRVTLDYLEDYLLIKEIVEDFSIERLKEFTAENIIEWLDRHPVQRDLVIAKHHEG